MRMILSYKQNGNCIQVLREAVKTVCRYYCKSIQYKNIWWKITVLLYYPLWVWSIKEKYICFVRDYYDSSFFIILFTVIIFVRSFRKVALYGLALAVVSAFALEIDSLLSNILVGITVVVLIGFGIVVAILSKGGSSDGGSYCSSRSSRRRGGGFSFGGYSRSRSSRSFRGGGRSGGGGAFRR